MAQRKAAGATAAGTKTRDHSAEYQRAKYLREHPDAPRKHWGRRAAEHREQDPPAPPPDKDESRTGMLDARPVQIGVDETPPALTLAAPVHEAGSKVPEAGAEGGGETPGATLDAEGKPIDPSAKTEDGKTDDQTLVLTPEVCVQLTKGLFALVALRGGEHWKVTDEEIEPIAEPMARQLQRIPLIAALGPNAADLIILGSTLGTLIFLRAQESIEKRREEAGRRAIAARRGQIIDIDPGRRHDFAPEPPPSSAAEPRPNLGMYAAPAEPFDPFAESG